jgi:hypothetical protein
MPKTDTDNTPDTATPPTGTPPAGGRWTWNNAWVPLPEIDEAAAPAAAPTTPATKE